MKEQLKRKVDSIDGIDPRAVPIIKDLIDDGVTNFGLSGYSVGDSFEENARGMAQFLSDWNMHTHTRDGVIFAVGRGRKWGLSYSETKALAFIHDTMLLDHEALERREFPDFIVEESVGIEVKSERNYKISRKQLQAASELHVFFVLLSEPHGVEKLDRIDWLGINTRPEE